MKCVFLQLRCKLPVLRVSKAFGPVGKAGLYIHFVLSTLFFWKHIRAFFRAGHFKQSAKLAAVIFWPKAPIGSETHWVFVISSILF